MPLTLKPIVDTRVPIELDGISPKTVAGKSIDEISRLTVLHGNRQTPLGELFAVSGDAGDETLVLEGDFSGVHRLGAKLSRGRIVVRGPAGRHVGSEMTGGEIVVEGDAGDWLGAQLRGGLVRVRGSAANHAGAAYAGSPRGMNGGLILIHGNAGNDAGAGMRRGMIAIGGAVGDFVGAGMLAGTIFVLGNAGRFPGVEMRRGTIVLFGSERPSLLPSFRRGATFHPPMLRLLIRHLRELEFSISDEHAERMLESYHGDTLSLGRGEILLPVAQALAPAE
jgi:formylmethanofuran dehydrogenase subunit C